MRLATFKIDRDEKYGIVTDRGVIDLTRYIGERYRDLKSIIADDAIDTAAAAYADASPDYELSHVTWLPVIPNPGKIICIGVNYEEHRAETANTEVSHPAMFLRTAESQTGHRTAIVRPFESHTLDYEAEIAVIIGKEGRRIPCDRAWEHIVGYSCYNDGSVREFQRHTTQYTAGKNFPGTGAFGPWMVTADEIAPGTPLTLTCHLNGELMQRATTDQMIFDIPSIIEYVSTVTPLYPGDVIVTGTPGGVGARRTPPVWMKPGDTVEIGIDKVGVLENTVADG
jgi:2-keto-4-pentenoate hydratase/2-oxohepta-3-ene-1,7-dioic acid hydratase in catechol pathway